jgi:hypothetical protein
VLASSVRLGTVKPLPAVSTWAVGVPTVAVQTLWRIEDDAAPAGGSGALWRLEDDSAPLVGAGALYRFEDG